MHISIYKRQDAQPAAQPTLKANIKQMWLKLFNAKFVYSLGRGNDDTFNKTYNTFIPVLMSLQLLSVGTTSTEQEKQLR